MIIKLDPNQMNAMLHDDDDWLFPGVLEKLLSKADERPDAVLAYGLPLNCDDSGASDETLETAFAARRPPGTGIPPVDPTASTGSDRGAPG